MRSPSKWSRRKAEIEAGLALLGRDWATCDDGPRGVLAGLREIDRKLVAKGFPPISPWWWATIERWYGRGVRTLVARVGRGGGKSSTLSRLAVAEVLYGDHQDIPGDVLTAAIVSVDRREAARRIATVKAILDALGEEYRPIDGGVRLVRLPRAFQVFTATIAGVSGFTSCFVFCDEVAKWRDADTGANPATEVLASIRPTFRGRPNARMVLSSSPMGELDAHADAMREGETASQCIAHGTSFAANPTMSEAQTRLDEPDEAKWRREYLAIPLEGTEESIYSPVVLDRCARAEAAPVPPRDGWTYVAAIDPATRGNAWTLVVATVDHDGKAYVVLTREWRAPKSAPLDPDATFTEIAGLLAPYRVKHVHSDQYGGDFAAAAARRVGLVLDQQTLTAGARLSMHEEIARRMVARQVELPPDRQLRADLLSVRRVLSRTGQGLALTSTPDGRHSDYAPSVALALSVHCRAPRELLAPADQVEQESLRRDLERYAPKAAKGRSLPGAPPGQRAWWERKTGKRRGFGGQ